MIFIVLPGTVPAGFCFTTNQRNVTIGLAFEALRESQLWTDL